MMLNLKTNSAFIVLAFGALISAAMGGGSNRNVGPQSEHGAAHDQLDSSHLHNLTQQVVQARGDAPAWNSKRTMVIGIGNAVQNVGTEARFDLHVQKDLLLGFVQTGIDVLCNKTLGFNQCETSLRWTRSKIAVKDSHGNLDQGGELSIMIGASYWPLAGMREVLRDAMAWAVYTIAQGNCWKPNFNGDGGKIELCSAPDKIMVRIDYVGWIVLLITSDSKGMGIPQGIKVCPQTNFYTGETQTRLEKKIKEISHSEQWYKTLRLEDGSLDVKTDCFYGTQPAGQGDGWCRTASWYTDGTKC